MTAVNLDALIPREDFEVRTEFGRAFPKSQTLKINDLEPNAFLYDALRKPDFQRETANWDSTKIVEFVRTFLDGDLIPAVILWQSGRYTFVIDGAHRLSALAAWVHDDYGDKEISRKFFQNEIPVEQQRAADRTRKEIDATIGSYIEHKKAIEFPQNSKPEIVERARRLGSLALQLQWVPDSDAKKAEDSFFKINQEAVGIDRTELRILKARTSPNAIAARVIVRNATGHKYWSGFSNDLGAAMETIGREIFSILFYPPLETPVKTLNLPVAGKSGQALPLIFDLVNLANGVPVVDVKKGSHQPGFTPDLTGEETYRYLKNTRDLAQRLSGTQPSSLGFDPAVYVYSASGKHQPTSFLAIVSLTRKLVEQDKLKKFTLIRREFEEFLITNKEFINQVVTKRGSGAKGYDWVEDLFEKILGGLGSGMDSAAILEGLKRDQKFSFLTKYQPADEEDAPKGKKFSRNVKSAAYIREALQTSMRCKLCGCRMQSKSISVDHAVDRKYGGTAHIDNAQLTHPYCNSIKDWLMANGKQAAE
nr:DUF262 domain-containing protein [Bradyrhizobium uaiense]